MRLRALAKINLGLDILRKREDGYHEVRMIMQTIQMYDVLEMKRVRKPGISLSVNYSYIPNDERNLVYKAAKLLMDEFQVKGGVDIHLEKFIPVSSFDSFVEDWYRKGGDSLTERVREGLVDS